MTAREAARSLQLIEGALASGFATSVTLHQVPGHERNNP